MWRMGRDGENGGRKGEEKEKERRRQEKEVSRRKGIGVKNRGEMKMKRTSVFLSLDTHFSRTIPPSRFIIRAWFARIT